MANYTPLCSAAIVAFSATQLAASSAADWLSMLSPDRIFTYGIQSAIVGARSFGDVTYSGLSVDALGGRATIYDINVKPFEDASNFQPCSFSAQRVTLRGAPEENLNLLRVRAEISSFELPAGCLSRDEQMMLRMAGLNEIEVPSAIIEGKYEFNSGSLVYNAFAEVSGLAAVTVDAKFPYISLANLAGNGDPSYYLSDLKISIEDRGGWANFSTFIPPNFRDQSSALQNFQGVLAGMKDDLAPVNDSPEWNYAFDAFAQSLLTSVPLFLENPSRLVLKSNIDEDGGVLLSLDDEEYTFFTKLRPTVSVAALEGQDLISPEDLGLIFNEAADAELHRIGMALLTGNGVPQNTARGIEFLRESETDVSPDTAALIAQELHASEPELAYSFALIASAGKSQGATALLDKIEPTLTLDTLQQLQGGLEKMEQPEILSLSSARELAQMYLDGQ
ncbi:MAG: hypothetical protein ABF308_25080, partial [Phaeobacter gallaeciensis]